MKKQKKINFLHKIGRDFFPALFVLALIFTLLHPAGAAELKYSEKDARYVISKYFQNNLAEQMRKDAHKLVSSRKIPSIKIFSTCQYGDTFETGYISLGDVFDATDPKNLELFKRYAEKNNLIANLPDNEHYNRYSKAATRFLKEFGYDAVIFCPDEFHPVFTRPSDKWIFIRVDVPGKLDKNKNYLSTRVKNHRIIAEGGIKMEPVNLPGFYQYYIPAAGVKYFPFKYPGKTPAVSNSIKISSIPMLSGSKMIKKQSLAGIKPCCYSGRKNLRIGAWYYKCGSTPKAFEFSGCENIYTWGNSGFYAIYDF